MNFNTLASQRFVSEGENEPFFLENVSNLTLEFLYDNFNMKIYQTFLLKIVIQKVMYQI